MIAMHTHNCTMTDPHAPVAAPAAIRWVACLCADWCGTCRDYRPLFDQVAAGHPGVVFVWLDIEEEAALVDEFDIETFPTVLVGEGRRLLFAGPVLPHVRTLSRMLVALDGQGEAVDDPALTMLAAALQARIRSGGSR
jgi:thiol-disulfide isomerase/thioredoxin